MVKKMKIEKKVELLNKFVGGSLDITHYDPGWELGSYKPGSFFEDKDSLKPWILGQKFSEVVEKAYKKMKEEKTRIKKEAKKWRRK